MRGPASGCVSTAFPNGVAFELNPRRIISFAPSDDAPTIAQKFNLAHRDRPPHVLRQVHLAPAQALASPAWASPVAAIIVTDMPLLLCFSRTAPPPELPPRPSHGQTAPIHRDERGEPEGRT